MLDMHFKSRLLLNTWQVLVEFLSVGS